MSTKKVFLAYVKGQIKGIFTQRDIEYYCGKEWWDKMSSIEVPLNDFMNGRVGVHNIQHYVCQYKLSKLKKR